MRRIRLVRARGASLLLLGQAPSVMDDSVGVQIFRRPATPDGPLDAGDRMFGQQLQDADVLTRSGRGAVPLLQAPA